MGAETHQLGYVERKKRLGQKPGEEYIQGAAKESLILLGEQRGQFSLVTQLCPTLYDPMDYSTPGFPVH